MIVQIHAARKFRYASAIELNDTTAFNTQRSAIAFMFGLNCWSAATTLDLAMSTRLDFTNLDLMDALDLAVLIEAEAYDRYKMFAAQLGHRFAGDATSVFASMAENEAKHGKELAERRKSLFGDTPMRVSLDDLFDVEAPDMGAPRSNMSTLQAFEVALAAEQKAHAFYDQALAHVTNAEIHTLFVELRDEETDHVRMVREAIVALPPGADREWEEDEGRSPGAVATRARYRTVPYRGTEPRQRATGSHDRSS